MMVSAFQCISKMERPDARYRWRTMQPESDGSQPYSRQGEYHDQVALPDGGTVYVSALV